VTDDTTGLDANDSTRFDRLPATTEDRTVEARATRREVLEWYETRFGIDPGTFEEFSFWEKGAGKVWVLADAEPSPVAIEALGMTFLRTRQEHWKPTTEAVQRFCADATKNVVELDDERARRFLAGEDQDVEWDGDWGYLVAAHEVAGERAPIGVGLYTYGELKSMVPKGRRREF
jgi:NOL1/NOP2/fmu family ribosome biogenesis protein